MAYNRKSRRNRGRSEKRSAPRSNKALLYARVSTENQAEDGYSREAQVRSGMQYAAENSLVVFKTFKVAESAWKSDRKGFNAMVEMAKKRKDIGHLIFYVADRMARNDEDKVTILKLIKQHGIRIIRILLRRVRNVGTCADYHIITMDLKEQNIYI